MHTHQQTTINDKICETKQQNKFNVFIVWSSGLVKFYSIMKYQELSHLLNVQSIVFDLQFAIKLR